MIYDSLKYDDDVLSCLIQHNKDHDIIEVIKQHMDAKDIIIEFIIFIMSLHKLLKNICREAQL